MGDCPAPPFSSSSSASVSCSSSSVAFSSSSTGACADSRDHPAGAALDRQPLEHLLRQKLHNQHDSPPVVGKVDHLFALLDGAVDALSNRARAGEKRPLFQSRCHR